MKKIDKKHHPKGIENQKKNNLNSHKNYSIVYPFSSFHRSSKFTNHYGYKMGKINKM